MGAPANGRELLELLQRSQLLNSALLEKLMPQVEKHLEGDPQRLARTLIKNSLVTEFQARQLLTGRYKGFYLAKYKLLELLGAGGMGKVFLAEQVTMERLVAIKLIGRLPPKDRQKEVLARFAREARAVAALRHPNIVHAYDFDTADGVPYIVMEYVEGIDTAHIVGKFGPIPWPQAADYARQAASGLQNAHSAGMVHRDIKPGNLLVDDQGQVKILDLGLCSAFSEEKDDSLTVDQDQLGTVDYVAPEQAVDSHSVDGRADIYSLGATLYGILCGQPLYPGKSTAQKLLLHQTTDPTPIESLVTDLPADLAAVVKRMLAKKPEDRFQTAAEVEAALQPFSQSKNPPYDLSAIKFRRSTYEAFLRKSPDPSEISVQQLAANEAANERLKADSPTPTPRPGEKPAKKAPIGSQSMISMKAAPEAELANLKLDETVTQLALPMPSTLGKKKSKPGSKKKKQEVDATGPVLASLFLGLLMVAGIVAWFVWGRGIHPTAEANGNTAAVAAAPPSNSNVSPKGSPGTEVAPPPKVELRNGDMAQFGEIPAYWDVRRVSSGRLTASRDLSTDQGTAGSLKVQSSDSATEGFVAQSIKGGAGLSVTLSGRLKLDGSAKAAIIAVPFGKDDGDLRTEELFPLNAAADWTTWSKSLAIPADAAGFLVGVRLKGEGTAWLDDVQLAGDRCATNNSVYPSDSFERWRLFSQHLKHDPDLVAYFPFVKDVDRNGSIYNGSATFKSGFVRLNDVGMGSGRWPAKKALSFGGEGSNQFAEMSKDFDEHTQFDQSTSLGLWVRVKGWQTEYQTLLSRDESTWRLHRASNSEFVAMHVGTKREADKEKGRAAQEHYAATAKTPMNDGRWRFVVVTYDASTKSKPVLKIYVDGRMEGEASRGTYIPSNTKRPVWIGANGNPGFVDSGKIRTLNGDIDELMIWKRTLTEPEISQIYEAGKPQ